MSLFSFGNEHFYSSLLQVAVMLFDGDEGQTFSGGILNVSCKASLSSRPGADRLICDKLVEFEFIAIARFALVVLVSDTGREDRYRTG